MDAESGDDDRDYLTSEWGGESRQNWLGDEMNLEVGSKYEVIHI